jgi:hypothetical protein
MNDYPLFKDQLEDQIQTMLDKVLDDDKDDNDFIDCLDEELPGFFDENNVMKKNVVMTTGGFSNALTQTPETPKIYKPRSNYGRNEQPYTDDFICNDFPVYNQHLSTSLSNNSNLR